MKIWDLVDKRLLKYLIDNGDVWMLVDKDGVVKKVGNSSVVRRMMKEGEIRFKIKRFSKLEF